MTRVRKPGKSLERVVVDTSVISYLLKRHSLAPLYQEQLRGRYLSISFMTVAELYRWSEVRGWGEGRISALISHLRRYVILPSDDQTSWEWARITARKGRPMPSADAWIAAAALRHKAPLVTHNPRDFQHIEGLSILTVSG